MNEGLYQKLRALEGTESGLRRGNDRVNEAMIRHWCEAIQDANPVYTDRDYAATSRYGGIIAPPAMVQAHCTPPLWPEQETAPDPIFLAVRTCVEAGCSASLGVSMAYEFLHPLCPGDEIIYRIKLLSVSPRKSTKVGTGHFLAAEYHYSNQTGLPVCRQVLTVFQYHPHDQAGQQDQGAKR